MNGRKEIALEERRAEEGRLFSPSAARNCDPIREAFVAHMPHRGGLLEIGSGTGEHVVRLAAALPEARFLPGDPDAASRTSIAAWTAHSRLENIAPPHDLDACRADWDERVAEPLAGVFSINMIHIAPFAAAQGIFAGSGRLLGAGGRIFLYGPFSRRGVHQAASNAEFDRSLKARDPNWGVRDLEYDLCPLAAACRFDLAAVVEMPANNLSIVFARR